MEVVIYGDRYAVILEGRELDRVNTILLRHSVGITDTKPNKMFAGQISNAMERVRPRPIDNATPEGDEA